MRRADWLDVALFVVCALIGILLVQLLAPIVWTT